MPSLPASGYHGPPELTLARALTEWMIDPWAVAGVLAVCVLYLAGVRRLRRAGGRWPAGRTAALAGGMVFAIIATCSFVGVYWPVLFYVRAIQTVLLLLAVPLFVALSKPLTLAIAASPRLGPRIEAAVAGRVVRTLTFPAITALVLVLTPIVLYFSGWYEAGFHSQAVHELTCLLLVMPGLVFFWTLLRVDPVPRAYPYLVSLWVTAAEVVGDAMLGLAVIADRHLLAGSYYHGLGRPWGPSLATDQVLGGGVLWILGDVVGLPFLAAVLIAMIREDESQARTIDAELDAAEAVAVLRTGEGPAVPGAGDSGVVPGAGETDAATDAAADAATGASATSATAAQAAAAQPGSSLWWESDPRFAGRFAPVDRRPDRD